MTKKIGPKEAALQAAREDGIPAFLKRTETPEQAAKRQKRDAKKPDLTGGLKVIEPVDPKIRKAIEKDLRDDKPPRDSLTSVLVTIVTEAAIPVADLEKSKNPAAIENKKSWDKIPAVAKAKKLPRALQKALAEKERLAKLSADSAATPMENTVKKTSKINVKAKNKAKNGDNTKGASKIFTDQNIAAAAALIKRKSGALSSEIQKACKWTPILVRRFVRDIARKKLKLRVVCERTNKTDSTYKIA